MHEDIAFPMQSWGIRRLLMALVGPAVSRVVSQNPEMLIKNQSNIMLLLKNSSKYYRSQKNKPLKQWIKCDQTELGIFTNLSTVFISKHVSMKLIFGERYYFFIVTS